MSETPNPGSVTQLAKRPERQQAIMAVFPGEAGGQPVQALVKTTEKGIVRNMMVQVPLSEAKGEIYTMAQWKPPAQKGGRFEKVEKKILTAAGYDRLNLFGGVSFITPEKVSGDDGEPRPNPYLHRVNEEIRFVRIRMIGIGRNPTGNLVAHDYTLTYDLGNYLAQDLMSKWTGRKDAEVPKSWGRVYPAEAKPKLDGNWMGYAVPGGVKLWVDLDNKEVLTIIQEHIRRQLFAERNAITICRRNILKKHFALAQVSMGSDGAARAPVVGWQEPDRNFERMATVFNTPGHRGQVELEGQAVSVTTGDERVSNKDEIDEALAGDNEAMPGEVPEEQPDEPTPGVDVPAQTGEPEPQEDPRCQELRAKGRELVAAIGRDRATAALQAKGIEAAKLAECSNVEMLQAAVRELEDAKLRLTQELAGGKAATAPTQQQPSLIPDNTPPAVEAPAKFKGKR